MPWQPIDQRHGRNHVPYTLCRYVCGSRTRTEWWENTALGSNCLLKIEDLEKLLLQLYLWADGEWFMTRPSPFNTSTYMGFIRNILFVNLTHSVLRSSLTPLPLSSRHAAEPLNETRLINSGKSVCQLGNLSNLLLCFRRVTSRNGLGND